MSFLGQIVRLLITWNLFLTSSHPLDSLFFDDLAGEDLSAGTAASDLFWPPSADSSLMSSLDESSPLSPLVDNQDDTLVSADGSLTADDSLTCWSKRNLLEYGNEDNDHRVQARDEASSSCPTKLELDLPLDAFSNQETWLRENLPIEKVAPDKNFGPRYNADGSLNDKADLDTWENGDQEPCAFPFQWHVCCDHEFGRRPSDYFTNELVTDYMTGCQLSESPHSINNPRI